MHLFKNKSKEILEHFMVFVGDLLPYGVIFLMTLIIGYGLGLEAAGFFSVTYVYVAIVTGLVCGPNLLSVRRSMPRATSPGAVVLASLVLRITIITIGALVVMGILYASNSKLGMISLAIILFLGRFFETSADGPAISVQYLRGARYYFTVRLTVFLIIFSCVGYGVFNSTNNSIHWVATYYLIGSALGFLVAVGASYKLLIPQNGIVKEIKEQALDFSKFFIATALFLAASRLQPVIISYFYDDYAAGQFAMVQNLFSALAVVSTGIAGVFFWSRNRTLDGQRRVGIPHVWILSSMVGGLGLGVIGGFFLDRFYLQPLDSSQELRIVGWLLCLSTPLMLIQTILSNQLVLLKRDKEMLLLSGFNAVASILMIIILVKFYGLIGAALSIGTAAALSSLIGILILKSIHE
jgi:O-antigen/teichoic acid export membrane protein